MASKEERNEGDIEVMKDGDMKDWGRIAGSRRGGSSIGKTLEGSVEGGIIEGAAAAESILLEESLGVSEVIFEGRTVEASVVGTLGHIKEEGRKEDDINVGDMKCGTKEGEMKEPEEEEIKCEGITENGG